MTSPSDLIEYNNTVRRLFFEIAEIKEAIDNDDLSYAAGLYYDLDDKDKDMLWKAPRDGGIFTTKEREVIKILSNYL